MKLPVGQKQMTSTRSDWPMLKDMLLLLRPPLDLKKFRKIKFVKTLQNQCLVSILMIIHVIFRNIMRQKGNFIAIIVAYVLHKIEKLMPTVQVLFLLNCPSVGDMSVN